MSKHVEMSRSWSSAHDWKSCKGQKLFESSNLSISAKKQLSHRKVGELFFISQGEIRKGHERSERNMPGACFGARVRAGAVPAPGESLHLRQKTALSPKGGGAVFISQGEIRKGHAQGGISPSTPQKRSPETGAALFSRNRGLLEKPDVMSYSRIIRKEAIR